MTKFMKVCLIAGSICVLVGGGISLTAAALGGSVWKALPNYHAWKEKFTVNDFDYKNQDIEERQEVFSSDKIRNMDLDIRSGQVAFVDDSSADEITISCNKDKSYYRCFAENNVLKVQVDSNQPDDKENMELVLMIHVPEDFHFSGMAFTSALEKSMASHHLKNRPPSISVQSLSADELNLVTKSGTIIIKDGSVGKLDIRSDVGAVEYSGAVTGDIVTDCKVGSVNLVLNGKKADFNYMVNCKIGSMEIGNQVFTALNSKKTIDNGAAKTMDLDCRTGAIKVAFAENIN